VCDLLAALNRVAGEWPVVHERDHEPTGFQWLEANDADHSVYGFLRWGYAGGAALACVANFTPVPRGGYRVGLPWSGDWQVLVDTDSPRWAGSGYSGYSFDGSSTVPATGVPWQGQPASAVVDLPPLAVLWLAARRP
jgi:1,4-alpha-glucan branching enzyme